MPTARGTHERLKAYERLYRELTSRLAQVGFIWPGTVVRQRLTCGKAGCACGRDERSRHGPYYYWTTKVKGRTVSQLLEDDQGELYIEWIQNRRAVERTLRKMRALSKKAAPVVLRQRRSGTTE
jgi:hypothetical protein